MIRAVAGLLPVGVAALLLAGTPPGGFESVSARSEGPAEARSRAARVWQAEALRLPEAWKVSTGRGVLVAVLDTGVDPRHPDLAGAVVEGPDLTGQARAKARSGHHGTAMASLIAGRGHDGGHGVVGVAPDARVLSVRVTLENDDPMRARQQATATGRDALARGIRYAVDRGAQVVSMSLGGGSGAWEGSAAEEEAVQYAISRGTVLVASSGNDGDSTNRKNFPAAYPGVIAVGAVDRRLKVPEFSNRQDYLSVVAPGTQIVSADGPGGYVVGDGTSSAAAMVAGIAALIRAEYPDLSPYHVRTAIERGTKRRPADGHSRAYGHGVADALLALREAARLARPPASRAERVDGYFGGGPLPDAPGSRVAVVLAMIVLTLAMSARVIVLHFRERRHSP
ncbi:S8 family serine peptidase [Nonomuraea typhae]|uniref:S8 family serine peptidase n=1 Tax=Nonomuraea typhae TaxID=2603600 RepID=UPI0012F9A0C6|nr:S8 family serine peptidase [Nonomuraea typhae]